MLAWPQPQQFVQWAAVATFFPACLPAMKADPAEAGQQVHRPALISQIPAFLLLHKLIFHDLTGSMQELLSCLLKSLSDFVLQFFQGYSIFAYT
jgi:hypothetical protein